MCSGVHYEMYIFLVSDVYTAPVFYTSKAMTLRAGGLQAMFIGEDTSTLCRWRQDVSALL